MKKIILSVFVLVATSGICFADDLIPAVPSAMYGEMGRMQNTDSQMRLMKEQMFRQEEYNDYNDSIQDVKAKRINDYRQYQEEKAKLYSPSQNLNFVRENGHLILKSTD